MLICEASMQLCINETYLFNFSTFVAGKNNNILDSGIIVAALACRSPNVSFS